MNHIEKETDASTKTDEQGKDVNNPGEKNDAPAAT